MSFSVPILYLVFNRPDLVAVTFPRIKELQPRKLYIGADGPRTHKPEEAGRCAQTRQYILDQIDWPCEVRTLFREENLGCRQAVSQAIDWFFAQEEAGIILEDDILASPEFFSYCEELLEKYRHDMRVFSITGYNLMGSDPGFPYSYWYYRSSVCWGWASWRDRWAHFSADPRIYEAYQKHDFMNAYYGQGWEAEYYTKYLEMVFSGKLSSWAYLWSFAHIRNGAHCLIPRHSYVRNTGLVSTEATHTGHDKITRLPEASGQDKVLIHPDFLVRNAQYEAVVKSIFTYTPPTLAQRIRIKLSLISKKYFTRS
ncbi:MAG: nucleotide-diphospho-sugar transferase [Bacteroidetes bacterium]|nr:nucleotide-diphospho-sugar transferase [Bacteroidota bacterium]